MGVAERLAAATERHKLASPSDPLHKPTMRLIVPAIALLLLSACGSNPKPAPVTQIVVPEPRERGELIGMSVSELVARLGTPRLQLREGNGTKLQFEAPACLLDAYLYPQAGAAARVTHVDTRNREGRSVDQSECLRMLDRQ